VVKSGFHSQESEFTANMKKIFLLLMFISVTMICSCGKQDSSAERQLAQRKAELDAREQSLDERVNELNERVNALDDRVNELADAEKERMNARAMPPGVQGQIPDDAQVKAEMDSTIQQLQVDEQSRVPDPSQLAAEMAEKVRRTQEQQRK
jgi:hypothetical protein